MMSFDPREYERCGGDYSIEPASEQLVVFGQEIDPDSVFAKDFSAFSAVNKVLREQAVAELATEVPDGYSYLFGIRQLDVLDNRYIRERTMQQLGYHVVIATDQKEYGESSFKYEAAVYQHLDEVESAYRMIMKYGPKNWLIFETTLESAAGPRRLDEEHPHSWYQNIALAPLKDTDLFERGFMTHTLRSAVHEAQVPYERDDLQKNGREGVALYEQLANKGHTPLGPEELYGLMASAIHEHLEAYPEDKPVTID